MKTPTKVLTASVIAALCLPLSGCASAGDTTCAEFKKLDHEEKNDLLESLLRQHDLSTSSMSNVLGVSAAVESYCSKSSHAADPVDKAVNWESSTW